MTGSGRELGISPGQSSARPEKGPSLLDLMHARRFFLLFCKRLFVIKLITTGSVWIFDVQNYFQR
jgi:hypothetical protein